MLRVFFLNGFIKEDVYVEQPSAFKDYKFRNHIYRLKKALYGLKQWSRSWYEILSTFLLENDFTRGKIDSNFFIKRVGEHVLLIQVYVDDIMFESTDNSLCEGFASIMQEEFECQWWKNWHSSLDCKLSKWKTEPSYLNLSTTRRY